MSEETLQALVQRREEQGHNVLVVDLVRADGGPLPAFDAGAHIDLHLGDGLVRPYSLASAPSARDRYRLGILKDPASRGGSVAAHQRLQAGATLRIGLPRNHFPLAEGATHTVLVGGGIGITPMIAMAHALSEAGQSFELHYCGRTEAACAFLDELRGSAFAAQVHTHFDNGSMVQRLDLDAVLGQAAPGTHLYVCGPGGFMDWVIGEAQGLGLPEAQIHKEYFQVASDTSGKAFDVVAQKSGQRVRVEADQSIVEALAGIGIKVQVSCVQGVCGTCLCTVLEGTPDHRDVFLTEDEKADNDQILLCCSRAQSDTLVLDL
ncbi:MAG: PDR/VanB family oxidoreductase [Burkholderiaceae bacterium]|nr:PDR/VanB family oxidoreductase [Burkholderiaceae bacterium]